MTLLLGSLTIGLILSLLALGVFISFRVFDFPDITVDGSTTLGASIAAVLLVGGTPPVLATAASFCGGALAGATTGVLHTKFRINGLLSGILVMTALYSVNLRVMGKSNIPLMQATTLATEAEHLAAAVIARPSLSVLGWEVAVHDAAVLALMLGTIVLIASALYLFFRTDLGTAMRATGDNPQMIRALGVDVGNMTILGLAVSNGLTALAGALLAQYQGFADVQMGIGMVVWGLASVIIGEALVGTPQIGFVIIGAVMGSVLFRLLIAIALRAGLNPNDLKLVTAVFVFMALIVPNLLARFSAGLAAMLEISAISKTFYAGTTNEVRALQGVDLTIEDGSFVIVIGTNGSGKSTLLNAVAGTFLVDSGHLRIDGHDVTRWPEHRRARMIGRVFQNPFSGTAPQMTIAENVALAARRGRRRSLRWALGTGLSGEMSERVSRLGMGLEDRLHNNIGTLSGGQRQALTLLMATWLKPQLLLLDEHTAALDPKSADQVIRLSQEVIERDRLTTLMVTHSMQQAANLGDRLIMMYRGRVLHDLSGAEKRRLRAEDLLARFEEVRRSEQLDESAAEMLSRTYV